MGEVLVLNNYKVYYRTLKGYVKAVDGVNLTVEERDILGVIGESGCGKTTLMQSLILPKPPMFIAGGSARFRNVELTKLTGEERRKLLLTKISVIPQYSMNALPVIKKIKSFLKDLAESKGQDPREITELFIERAKLLGLPRSVIDMYPLELSGGMKQRAVIVLATMFSPDLLIADEPTSSLDTSTQRYVIELLWDLWNKKIVKTMIFVTHDIATVRQIATKLAIMYAGKIVEIGPLEEVITNPLHPYTRKLIGSIPTLDINYKIKRLTGLKGSPPNLFNPPKGCRFYPRCPNAQEICREREPPLIDFGNGHFVACWLYAS
ncbi:ABC transporter ATP-binding protein [Staphylothermus hellenicus]|uniref:Oligopeptide/dipeptide ABC transporter, ATPase subunit n=1 Tax=Staphylothermus hellenicus (strain DSM 12710 / JCM 10830 / BK20S6-10-b1 / P8) TaxID=591019 RepID=D7D817_STAHD|nr:ABC transporter ATP-binding protein [Staphylothermus hellenicus]ADI31913.1 oligopeptide/dipeptide ABC transporter, ATPase subunit [Staphylothermus hellenicus DSM 12710]